MGLPTNTTGATDPTQATAPPFASRGYGRRLPPFAPCPACAGRGDGRPSGTAGGNGSHGKVVRQQGPGPGGAKRRQAAPRGVYSDEWREKFAAMDIFEHIKKWWTKQLLPVSQQQKTFDLIIQGSKRFWAIHPR